MYHSTLYDRCYLIIEPVVFIAVSLARSFASSVAFCTKELEPIFCTPDHTPDIKVPSPMPITARMATMIIIHVTMPNTNY